jgi:hypothetical protein
MAEQKVEKRKKETSALAITAALNQPMAGPPPAEFRGFKWGIAPTKAMQKVGGGVWKNPKKDLNPLYVPETWSVLIPRRNRVTWRDDDRAAHLSLETAIATKQAGAPA